MSPGEVCGGKVCIMRRWPTFVLSAFIVSLVCVFSPRREESQELLRDRGHGLHESPSLLAPLVIAMCECSDAAMEAGDTVENIVSQADVNDRAAFQLRGSWIRQRDQVTTLLKSLLLFSTSPVWRILVLTDNVGTFEKIVKITTGFPDHQRRRLRLERRVQWYPEAYSGLAEDWRPCAWAKQFLAEALPNEDAVIYVDTDIAFLGPPEGMWDVLTSLDSHQVIALAAEPQYLFDDPKRPFAGAVGLNTGVMVANLTRQRRLPGGGLGSAMIRAGVLHRRNAHRHDQDALNHYLKNYPHLFREMSSRWNFIASDCKHEAPFCPECVSFGIAVLHGADATFYRPIDRKFLVLYETLLHFSLEEDPHHLLLQMLLRLQVLNSLRLRDYPCHDYPLFDLAVTRGLSRLAPRSHHDS